MYVNKDAVHTGWHPLSFGGLTDHSRKRTGKTKQKHVCMQPCASNAVQAVKWMRWAADRSERYKHAYLWHHVWALDFPRQEESIRSPTLCLPLSLSLSALLVGGDLQARRARHVTGWSQGPLGWASQPARSVPPFSKSSRVTQRKQYQDSQLSTHNSLMFWCDELTWRPAVYDNAERWNTACCKGPQSCVAKVLLKAQILSLFKTLNMSSKHKQNFSPH